MKRIRLADVAFDAGTQIRSAIDQQVVADYAEAMTAGATFPPIVLFHDGNAHYLADGFHRFMAAQRIEWREIDADVRAGTKEDALWFALGANKTNGKRLSDQDKKHAIVLAIKTWPTKSMNEIAEQVGCSRKWVQDVRDQVATTSLLPASVTGRDGKVYPAKRGPQIDQRQQIEELLRAGVEARRICKRLGVSPNTIAGVRRGLGGRGIDLTAEGVKDRRDRMRQMAQEGHTSIQIADELGLSIGGCRDILQKASIDVPADKVTRNSKRHDANRILERIVMDAENLTEGVNLIDFADVHRDRIAEWLKSLSESRDKLGALIRRLMKEQQKHGEAA